MRTKQFLMVTPLLPKLQYISKQAFFQISPGKKGNNLLVIRFFFPQLHPDIFSCRRGSSSSGASSTGLEKPHCLVAVHDYDPFCSGVPGLPPHDQLPLKKGDIMTTLEDQDANGFYRVFLKGESLRLVLFCFSPSNSQSKNGLYAEIV